MVGVPNRDRRAERREATRLEILDAAWQVARDRSLAGLTLRDVAERVGMRAPSLYSHFDSKNAIYDAMFGQAWAEYDELAETDLADIDEGPRAWARRAAHHYFDFAVSDLARHQLMNQRTIPGFEPSAQNYAPAVRVLERAMETMQTRGVTERDDFDLWLALIAGIVEQHLANQPPVTRSKALLDRGIDMWADSLGLPTDTRETSRETRKKDAHRVPHH